mgnify:FL=1
MAQQLKRWESPRRKGRNHKGRGGSAKQRQYKKRQKRLMKRLQQGINNSSNSHGAKEKIKDSMKNQKTKYSGENLPIMKLPVKQKERPMTPLFCCP